jgi:hypothetical protein
MELTGKIIKIKGIETTPYKKNEGLNFQKREIWIEVFDDNYPQTIAFELHGDKVSLTDKFAEGSEVTVSVNLKGKVVNEKCFNTLQIWRIQPSKQLIK